MVLAYRSRLFYTSRGDRETTTIVALRNGVDLRRLNNTFLRKRKDSVTFDCNVINCIRYSSIKNLLLSLESQGVIEIRIESKKGYASKKPKKSKKKDRAKELAARIASKSNQESSKLDAASPSSSSSDPEDDEGYCLCFTSEGSVSSSSQEFCLNFSSSVSSFDSIKEKFGSILVEDKQETIDISATCREKLCKQLLELPGVSEKIIQNIFDLDLWDRASIDDIPYMRSSNVSRIVQIISPYRKVFNK